MAKLINSKTNSFLISALYILNLIDTHLLKIINNYKNLKKRNKKENILHYVLIFIPIKLIAIYNFFQEFDIAKFILPFFWKPYNMITKLIKIIFFKLIIA